MKAAGYPAGAGQGAASNAWRREAGESMHSAIVSATDRDAWHAMMQRVGTADVYYLAEYHRLYEFLGVRCLAYAAWDWQRMPVPPVPAAAGR